MDGGYLCGSKDDEIRWGKHVKAESDRWMLNPHNIRLAKKLYRQAIINGTLDRAKYGSS